MQINSIKFKNIASYGNEEQIISFEKDKSNFYLITGSNGYGKSTIANAIVFGLYGKIEGANLSDLPNRINGGLVVKIDVTCGTNNVVIERGLKPKKFSVKINNIDYDQASKLNVQEYLEKEIFKIPFHVFKNIIILSITEFKSFINMSNKDKRNIIDRLFGFSILNDMLKVIKDNRKDLKDEIKTVDDELNQLAENIVSINEKIESLEKLTQNKKNDKITDFKDKLKKLVVMKTRLSQVRIKLIEKFHEIELDIEKHKILYNNKKDKLTEAEKQINLRKQKKCPICGSPLDTEFHKEIKETAEAQVKVLPSQIKNEKDKIDKLKELVYINRNKQDVILQKASALSLQIQTYKNELINIAKSLKINDDDEFDHLKDLIDEFKFKEKDKSKSKIKKFKSDYFLNVMENILGEDGVKNLALKTILPALNTSIAQMANEMHLHFQIKFEENFDCQITHLGEIINPNTLSTGEKKKTDFVIIISIIKMMKLRFPQLNLLFLDEIFSSIDADGIHSILNILKKVIKENNLNVFVINHTVLPNELFDKKIDIYRENGFSKFLVETIQ
jgi:DNA repair exonuclease SbcCD ATPase subunit